MNRQIQDDALYNDEEKESKTTWCFEWCLIYLWILLIIFWLICLFFDKCAFQSVEYMPKVCLYLIAW